MSVCRPGFGSPPPGVRPVPLAGAVGRPYRRAMPLYVVPRTRAWLSEEELAATADCLPAALETVSEHVRWIRSYIVAEDDGTFSAFCVYEATSPQHLIDHAEALMLPTDAVKRVSSTVVAAPDPEPVQTA